MDRSNNTIERICKIYGYLNNLENTGIEVISSKDLAKAVGATEYTIRKDISLIGVTKYTRKGYETGPLKKELGKKLGLDKTRKACIVGLGRLGTALLDYERFHEEEYEVVAGFDNNINRLEMIRTKIEVFPDTDMGRIIKEKKIELGIIAVPGDKAQAVAEKIVDAGIKGILNFSPHKVIVPEKIVHVDMDFTNSLRFIAAQLGGDKSG